MRKQKEKMRANEPEFLLTQEKRHPPPEKEPLKQSQSESIKNVPLPLSLSFLMRAIKPWDKNALIHVLIDEGIFGIIFGIAFQFLVFKDNVTQLCSVQHIRVVLLTVYMTKI